MQVIDELPTSLPNRSRPPVLESINGSMGASKCAGPESPADKGLGSVGISRRDSVPAGSARNSWVVGNHGSGKAGNAESAGGAGGTRPDLIEALSMQQKDRIQRATDYLTASGVWPRPWEHNMQYIQETLKITDAETSTVFEAAQEIIIQPAIEFLSLPIIRQNPVEMKVQYLRQKMGLHERDIAKIFQRVKDVAGVQFFARRRLDAAVEFLANPTVTTRSADVKVDYLRSRLSLSDIEIQEAFAVVAERDRQAELDRINSELEINGASRSLALTHTDLPVTYFRTQVTCSCRIYWT